MAEKVTPKDRLKRIERHLASAIKEDCSLRGYRPADDEEVKMFKLLADLAVQMEVNMRAYIPHVDS